MSRGGGVGQLLFGFRRWGGGELLFVLSESDLCFFLNALALAVRYM
jgi:hypothetical protein